MSDINAAIGRAQLKDSAKCQIKRYYVNIMIRNYQDFRIK